MKRLFLAICLLLPLSLHAQTTSEDRGFLEGMLEDALSGAGRDVQIEGFQGALSSSATIEKLTIADDDGIWLTLTGVTLNWNRAALLSGALDVTELSAKQLRMPRKPAPAPSLPSAQATPLQLPDLPVSVRVAKFSVPQVVLGPEILGQAADLNIAGSARLADGSGSVQLSVLRQGDSTGQITFVASYARDTQNLALDLSLIEPQDGLIASALGIPDAPPLMAQIKGVGPLQDFRADITLSSEQQTRVSGKVTLSTAPEQPEQTRFAAQLTGDISALLPADYGAFFGPRPQLAFAGTRNQTGTILINQFDLRARAMTASGTAQISADGQPMQINLSARIEAEDGTPVLLPLTGPRSLIRSARLRANYDAEAGDDWSLSANLSELQRDGLNLDQAEMVATGTFAQQTLQGAFRTTLTGLSLSDPAQARAVGQTVTARTNIQWSKGTPFRLSDLALQTQHFDASGDVSIMPVAQQTELDIQLDLQTQVNDLAPFSGLAQRALAGAGRLGVKGALRPVSGAVDLEVSGETTELDLAFPRLDPFLRGRTLLTSRIIRNESGSELWVKLSNPALQLDGQGIIGDGKGRADLTLNIADLSLGLPELPGPAQLQLKATQTGSDWAVDAAVDGPGGANLRAAGQIAEDVSTADVTATGTAPLALVNGFIRPMTLSGMVRYDLTLSGRPSLEAVSGQVTAQKARLALPDQRLALEDIDASVNLSGGAAQLAIDAQAVSGGRLGISGPVQLTPPYNAALGMQLTQIILTDPTLYQTSVSGPLQITGGLTGGARISGQLQLGPTELRVPNPSGAEQADLPGLRHVNIPAAVQRTRGYAGLLQSDSAQSSATGAFALDLSVLAPDRIFVRGRGLDAELGGALALKGNTANVIPEGRFDLLRGRLDILGKRFLLTEGLVQLQGAFDPFIRFAAETDADGTTATIVIEGQASAPNLSFESSPSLPQDEVLALLLFGKDLSTISPLQAVRLAAAVRTLAGKGGDGISGKLRRGLALDDLDVTTTETGATQARAGKYISENIYSEVTADTEGNSQINLNLNINRSVTARGRLTSDGETGIGVFIEKDY
jgi:translocation and assembly module TamB